MKNLASLAFTSLLAVNAAGCLGDNDVYVDVPDAPQAKVVARTCAELVAADPSAKDGEHTLFIDDDETKPWTAYCADIATNPKEYLSIDNWPSQSYWRGPNYQEVVTLYRKLRIDPITLALDIYDERFAETSGSGIDSNGAPVTSVPLGVGVSDGGYGQAVIMVLDTPFTIVSDFVVFGPVGAGGEAKSWEDGQLIEMWSLGGSIASSTTTFATKSEFAIQLAYKQ